ncbi:response regulator transcription factor [Marinobacterium sp. D7]|uniref:response regulator transcription factor n=1 Tax=Marinobacterium ramblicola TaxID=2849041 RepID=UPI001C2DA750|nr:response regulator transcription factor [Marinobacterium ramblicola]MBV1789488.1 response regulator transcription factor [Marinobacterium ramblicola]
MRILIVEDDETLGDALSRRAARQGHGTDLVVTGSQADEILKRQDYDLIILDLNLPGLDGKRVLENLRKRKKDTPVLILTAREQVEDRITLLDCGADDYLTKPFDFGELEARCRALLRRKSGHSRDQVTYGNLVLDRNACTVSIDNELVDLKQREFRLLEIFLTHTGRVLSKDELLNHIYSFDESPSPNAIELYVARLRKKLSSSSVDIKTLRGLGYLLNDLDEAK